MEGTIFTFGHGLTWELSEILWSYTGRKAQFKHQKWVVLVKVNPTTRVLDGAIDFLPLGIDGPLFEFIISKFQLHITELEIAIIPK